MRGGKRQGAGRKKGFSAIEAEEARKFIAKKVGESLEPIVAVLIKQAKKGDIRSTQLLFERAYGKPLQAAQLEISSPSNAFDPGALVSYIEARNAAIRSKSL